ncbi:sialidase family protein [Pedobacter namyangjuensis]|uniref:sialidase family protein n=1 Tax=Pedobacter namyangjuensis TaxID=600626 RepID=UPI000DE3617B|nr:sialidase family protein [Pedobacter namyangjuensis]
MRKIKILAFVCLSFFFSKVVAQTATQQKYQLPLLKGKKINPVLRLAIEISNSGSELNGVTVNIPQNVEDVESIQLLALNQDSAFVTDAKLEKATVFSSAMPKKNKQLKLTGKLALKEGKNYFWLALKLKETADLQHHLNLSIADVNVGGKQVKPNTPQPIKQAIAIALRQKNQDNVLSHRIPGLATAKDGSLLAIYDARYTVARDLQGHIDIGLSRSTDKGKTWLPMQVVLDMGEWGGLPQKFNGVSDACILVDKNSGDIYVAGLWMYGVINEKGVWVEGLTEKSEDWNHQWKTKGSQPGFDVKQTAQFLIVKSTDNGKTWGKPVNLTKMAKKEEWWLWAPAPGQGITLKDGTLVFPTQGRDAKGKPFSNITYSKDSGKTWQTSNAAVTEETTENMAVELTDGSIMLNMRANANRTDTSSNNGRAIAVTTDLGQTWKEHETSHKALQEPTCMASIIRHDYTLAGKKSSVLLFCNPNSKIARNFITVKASKDDGKTWQSKVLLDEWKGRGYSCMTSIDNETIGVLYESSQADLVFQTIKIKDLVNN